MKNKSNCPLKHLCPFVELTKCKCVYIKDNKFNYHHAIEIMVKEIRLLEDILEIKE